MKYTYDTIAQHEIGTWNYSPVQRSNTVFPSAADAKAKARFTKRFGVWKNRAAAKTGKAILILAGDLLCQERFIEAYKTGTNPENYDFNYAFSRLKHVLTSSDLTIGNLEASVNEFAPYSNEQLFIGKYYNRNCPPQYLEALRNAGFDLLTTANNHTLDTGLKGLYQTNHWLDELGFAHTGSFTDSKQKHYLLVDVNGIRIGILAYARFTNFPASEYVSDAGRDQLLNMYSKELAERHVCELRKAGAEYIICFIHWGAEMVHTITDKQASMAQELADAGVDYIAGSHPHVVQPYDILISKAGQFVPVIYSLGNLTSHFDKKAPKTSLLIRLELDRNEDGQIIARDRYLPCYSFRSYNRRKYVPAAITNKKYATKSTNETLKERLNDTAKILGKQIRLCKDYDVPQEDNEEANEIKEKKLRFPFLESDRLHTEILDEYRLSEEFSTRYGRDYLARYPEDELVKSAISSLKKFKGEDSFDYEKDRGVLGDMIYTRKILGFYFWEYFVYGLDKITPSERTAFMSERTNPLYLNKLNPNKHSKKALNDKYRSYELLRRFYKRELIKIQGPEDIQQFNGFCSRHPVFISKPLNEAMGNGVRLIDVNEYDGSNALFNELLEYYHKKTETSFICEELIENAKSFKDIHPESVNSLRVFTYRNGDESRIVCAWLKAGQGDAIVDNGSSGGVIAAIDTTTGVICSDARDEMNHTYETHPDTGVRFKGFQIEKWDELVDTVLEISKVMPGMNCVGWDVALSKDKGWQVIEGNVFGMFNVLQVATQKGMRKEFLEAVELGSAIDYSSPDK